MTVTFNMVTFSLPESNISFSGGALSNDTERFPYWISFEEIVF